MAEAERAERHRARMRRKKAVVDAKIAAAQADRGVLGVLTGNGKGKSSSAFGMVARALGHGIQVGIAQFIKGRRIRGRKRVLPPPPRHALARAWRRLHLGETQNLERDAATARRGRSVARGLLRDPSQGLVVHDELIYPPCATVGSPSRLCSAIWRRARKCNTW